MTNINVEMLKKKIYPAVIALSCIGEVCVDVSKQHISAEDAIDKIRGYLRETDVIGSRYRVDQLIEECMVNEYIFKVNREFLESIPKANTDRISEAVKRTKRYIRKD